MLDKHKRRAKFVREVGSVVLGVLIALGIGEVADAARWNVRVRNSLAAMRVEQAGNRYNVFERRAYQPCIVNRLTQIGGILAEARKTGVLPEIENLGRPPIHPSEDAAFEVAKSEGVPLHMDRTAARDLATSYAENSNYDVAVLQERSSWQTLRLLEHAPGPISSDFLTTLLQAWADASGQAELLGATAQQQDDRLERAGVGVELDPAAPSVSALIRNARQHPICQPMVVKGASAGASR